LYICTQITTTKKLNKMTTDFKIIGFTDKVNECDCCNKTELKGTYCILIDGNEYYYGSTCASNTINISTDEIKKQVKKIDLEKNISILVENANSEYSKKNVLKLALKKGINKIEFFLKYGVIEMESDYGYFYQYANENIFIDK